MILIWPRDLDDNFLHKWKKASFRNLDEIHTLRWLSRKQGDLCEQKITFKLRWLKTVSSTFQNLDFDVSL